MGPKLHKWILVGFLDSIFRTSALEGPRGSHGFRTISMLRTSGSVICNPDLWVQTDTSNFLLDISTWYHIDILNLTPENIKNPSLNSWISPLPTVFSIPLSPSQLTDQHILSYSRQKAEVSFDTIFFPKLSGSPVNSTSRIQIHLLLSRPPHSFMLPASLLNCC